MRRGVLALGALLLVLAACGDDGEGDAGLVELLRDVGGQPEDVATCVADRLADADVDEEELTAIIRGEGSVDTATANAYQDATFTCTLVDSGATTSTPG